MYICIMHVYVMHIYSVSPKGWYHGILSLSSLPFHFKGYVEKYCFTTLMTKHHVLLMHFLSLIFIVYITL